MQGPGVPEPAVAVGEDPRSYARLMSAVYDATMSGGRAPARPRGVIGDSWRRLMSRGVDPENRTPPVVETDALEVLRKSDVPMVMVHDEYGHFEGIVTPADLLSAIAGHFADVRQLA